MAPISSFQDCGGFFGFFSQCLWERRKVFLVIVLTALLDIVSAFPYMFVASRRRHLRTTLNPPQRVADYRRFRATAYHKTGMLFINSRTICVDLKREQEHGRSKE